MSKFKFTWGHGLMVFLGCFMIFILSLVLIAGQHESMELRDEDYYERSVNYQGDIDAATRANSLVHKPEIVKQANGYLFQFYENVPENGEIQFMRLNNKSQDFSVPLKLDEKKEQLIHAVKLVDGSYEVSIRWKENNKDYLVKKSILWKDPSS